MSTNVCFRGNHLVLARTGKELSDFNGNCNHILALHFILIAIALSKKGMFSDILYFNPICN